MTLYFLMRWIVDGYNVILTDHRLSKVLRSDSEAARTELQREVVGSARMKKEKITLVYDGKFSTPEERITSNVCVKFSSPRETADDLIKREIADARKRSTLSVVTNDRAIVDYARECGARVLSSQDFLSLIRGPGSNKNSMRVIAVEKPEPTGSPDPELLKLFGEKKK